MISEIIFGLIGMTMALAFFAVPILKLAPALGFRAIPLIVVILIGVVMMVVEFIQTVRASRNDRD
ncbi:MAG: hypothetical protein A3G25_12815 [Betaproteobacteria bacterium RIFCSPLOWO2_12_FULL_63_13]|nr:MAG: hypothetical protein A3H32_06225 [Betaproteobacteria bacterium RIFCSPLOWO2_02_FULL_63_19]OGA48687.1 MAG: hypothetical protein A3G25_12815 [Betaproteobacteria bacterium RIFCSPLOWO2_12_FULL_63_13]